MCSSALDTLWENRESKTFIAFQELSLNVNMWVAGYIYKLKIQESAYREEMPFKNNVFKTIYMELDKQVLKDG